MIESYFVFFFFLNLLDKCVLPSDGLGFDVEVIAQNYAKICSRKHRANSAKGEI